MTPVWMIEGGATAVDDARTGIGSGNGSGSTREVDNVSGTDRVAERRFQALAEAVREHQSRRRYQAVPARPEDAALYRRLRQICGV